jgi:phenylalanine-4-hydroxylase
MFDPNRLLFACAWEAGLAITHVFESPPAGVAADWTMDQGWGDFTQAQHELWGRFIRQQSQRIAPHASERFVSGLETLNLAAEGIPDHRHLNRRLKASTGWTVVAVPGAIPNQAFFGHLAERRFPVANFLRNAESLDYSEEPDMFHDLFGHLPMLTDPVFADFMQAYGEAGLRASRVGGEALLGRLYLHTVEFGIVAEAKGLRGFGAGLLSSLSETVHALSGPNVRRLQFDLRRVMRTGYLFDSFQKEYFIIESFEQLLAEMEHADLSALYQELEPLGLLEPGDDAPGDKHIA